MEDMYRVVYTSHASNDLSGIQRYIAEKFSDPASALNQAARITKAAKSLAVFPNLYRVRRKDSKGRDIRYCNVDNYVIIYSVDDVNHIVNIVRIVYNRRDIDSLI